MLIQVAVNKYTISLTLLPVKFCTLDYIEFQNKTLENLISSLHVNLWCVGKKETSRTLLNEII